MNITFLSLSYFQKIAQEQHLTKAAEELHISQPALSKTLTSLEKELGVPLFDRVGRNITLNQYGECFLRYTDRILRDLTDAKRELKDIQQVSKLTVSIALYVASSLVPAILTEFSKAHPNIRFQILQQDTIGGQSAEVRRADLSLFSNIYPMENSHTVTLLREDLLMAMPEPTAAAYGPTVDLADFDGKDFICLQKGKSLRTVTDVYFQMAGITPNIILESDSPQTVREFIRAGIGSALVPSITWSSVKAERVALRPISSPHCQRYISLSWDGERYLPHAAVLLRDYLIENFRSFAVARSYLPSSALD